MCIAGIDPIGSLNLSCALTLSRNGWLREADYAYRIARREEVG